MLFTGTLGRGPKRDEDDDDDEYICYEVYTFWFMLTDIGYGYDIVPMSLNRSVETYHKNNNIGRSTSDKNK
ncbi:hypothetical protein TYRP_013103 [Tyrophagus putrescentiae]|nr:hypothetical protein TYRP_013103 [Tyrophagus putrescentiae]